MGFETISKEIGFIFLLSPEVPSFPVGPQVTHAFVHDLHELSAAIQELIQQKNQLCIAFGASRRNELMEWRARHIGNSLGPLLLWLSVTPSQAHSLVPSKGASAPRATPLPQHLECAEVITDSLDRHPEVIESAITNILYGRESSLPRHQRTLEALNQLFITLSAQRDLGPLYQTILLKSLALTNSDFGCLLVLEEKDSEYRVIERISSHEPPTLHAQKLNSIPLPDNSIASYVAATHRFAHYADVHLLKAPAIPQYTPDVDYAPSAGHTHKVGALLCLPLKNSSNSLVALLQLARKEKSEAPNLATDGPFTMEDERILNSIASQASICIENAELYTDIRRLFDGFVKASITAIESRDPSTAGHSERVAKLSVALARATTETHTGIYRSVRFRDEEIRELEYAAMLHDFGKIGVREEVLVKAKKLYSHQLKAVEERAKIYRVGAKIQYMEKKLQCQLHGQHDVESLDKEFQSKLLEIQRFWEVILVANEPTILPVERRKELDHIMHERIFLPDGSQLSLLSDEEYQALCVPKGSLTSHERDEIESHVRHTYQFLKMIPWTREFRHLSDIAYAHHEKLDGSGYPRGLTAHEIPLQSKIMTIADIFDALTASDRWYKEAVPVQKAVQILGDEVSQGKLDPVLFEIFVARKIFETVTTSRSKTLATNR